MNEEALKLLEHIAKNTDHKTSFQVIVSGNQSSFNTIYSFFPDVSPGYKIIVSHKFSLFTSVNRYYKQFKFIYYRPRR